MRKAVSGLRAWLVQRVSAVYMLFFVTFLLIHLTTPGKTVRVECDSNKLVQMLAGHASRTGSYDNVARK